MYPLKITETYKEIKPNVWETIILVFSKLFAFHNTNVTPHNHDKYASNFDCDRSERGYSPLENYFDMNHLILMMF